MSTQPAETRDAVSVSTLSKQYGGMLAVNEVSLNIKQGEFFALLGPSGCGKTTLLRLIGGFEVPTSGTIMIDGIDATRVPPNRRPVNTVFQSYAVFPHMSVAENVGYGLRVDGVGRAERESRVKAALALVQMAEFGLRKPDQLSGGQRQRVALARALVKDPKVLLLDEPLSALDAKLRESMRFELNQIQQRVGITFLMVTHDQSEAMALASRIAVMRAGSIEQLGTPVELYETPASRFVCEFLGAVNLCQGRVEHTDGTVTTVSCPDLHTTVRVTSRADAHSGASVWIALRPENVRIREARSNSPSADGLAPGNAVGGRVEQRAYLGDSLVYQVVVPSGRTIRISEHNSAREDGYRAQPGDRVWVTWRDTSINVLPF